MRNNQERSSLSEVRQEVQQACAFLRDASPAAMDRCSASLEAAVERLMAWRRGAALNAPATLLRTEAQRLRASIRDAATLLERAAKYHAEWSRLAGALCAGYTPSGRSADAPRPARLCLRG